MHRTRKSLRRAPAKRPAIAPDAPRSRPRAAARARQVQRLIDDEVSAAAGVTRLAMDASRRRVSTQPPSQPLSRFGGWPLQPQPPSQADAQAEDPGRARERLRHVVLWLHLNSMRLEKMQFQLLCEQATPRAPRRATPRA